MSKLTDEQLSQYKHQFSIFDEDGDGKITLEELKRVFQNLGKKKKKFFKTFFKVKTSANLI